MSFWNSENEAEQSKIDTIGKLQVIFAIENGQSKADIAREYSVHVDHIANIYKRKESIWKKYKDKYNLLKQVYSINLDKTLLTWFESQAARGNLVNEGSLREKAQELARTLTDEFNCVDDWLLNFRVRHNIQKFNLFIDCTAQAKEEWMQFLREIDYKNVYVGGVSALYHSLDFDSFINEHVTDNYVYIFFIANCFGADKKELCVTGKEALGSEFNSVKSLPVKYYYCNDAKMDSSSIVSRLQQWDGELSSQGKSVILLLALPGLVDKIQLRSIRLIDPSNLPFVTKSVEKLIQSLKYNYRKLQIIRKVAYGKHMNLYTLVDYIDMMSLAWYYVSCQYINHLFFPPENGTLYFGQYEDNTYNHSLSQWCQTYNIPVNLDIYSNLLDAYINCDAKIECPVEQSNSSVRNVSELLLQKDTKSMSSVEAYQAVKRLINYLQGENACLPVVTLAKYLEQHIENEAVIEIQECIDSTTDESK